MQKESDKIETVRKEFETWFFLQYRELFHRMNPLDRDSKGVYTDRGTLGMWVVWCKKEEDMMDFKRRLKTYLNDNF